MTEQKLTRQAVSEAVAGLGWRLLLGRLQTAVAVYSMAEAADVAARAVAACGDDADGHLRVDLRADRVILSVRSLATLRVTERDIDLARRISAAGLKTAPDGLQVVEIGIDAADITAVRRFWAAILGYHDDGGALVDPVGQGPAVWFQRMDQARTERNRLHFDICVPHDEAADRISKALSAGGRYVYTREAPAFWVLADPEGNEACVTTWQGRD